MARLLVVYLLHRLVRSAEVRVGVQRAADHRYVPAGHASYHQVGIVHVLRWGIVVLIPDCQSRHTIPPNTYCIQIAVIVFLIVRGEYALTPNPPT